MGNHIRIVSGPTLYFIPINRTGNFIRLSQLAHTAWRGDGHYISIVGIQPNFMLKKRMSGKTWLEQYHTGRINPYVATTFRNLYSVGFGPWVLCLLGSAKSKKSLGDHWITVFYSVASIICNAASWNSVSCSTLLFTATLCNVAQHHTSLRQYAMHHHTVWHHEIQHSECMHLVGTYRV